MSSRRSLVAAYVGVPRQTRWTASVFVDGVSFKNDILRGGVAGQDASKGNPFPQVAVQEFRVVTQQFKAEYQKAQQEYVKQYRAAKPEERKGLVSPDKDFLAKYQELADRAKGTDAGAEALIEVMQLSQRAQMR